jgi:hypothetical protein
MNFLRSLPAGEFGRLYDMAGSSIIDHQNEVSTGMWLVAAMAAKDEELQKLLGSQFLNHAQNVFVQGFFGETTQFYYNQSLALLAAATFSGDFQNLYVDE